MRFFPLAALVLACALAAYSIAVKDKEGLAFASGALALAGTAYQSSGDSPKQNARNRSDSSNPNDL